jgi:branched-chain amino acid transport system substrate-binding protein
MQSVFNIGMTDPGGRTMRRCRAAMVGASLALTLAVAGCSSSGKASPSGSGGGTPSTEIPVGVIGSYSSGAFPSLNAAARDTSQAWASWVNDHGGINGHKVKLYIEDDKGDAATAAAAAKTLIEKDHVVAIVGNQSQNAAPWGTYVASKGVPVVGGNTFDLIQLKNADFFSVGGNLLAAYYGVATLAMARGENVGNLYCAEVPACAATTSLLTGFGKSLGGLSVTYAAKVSATAPDFTAPCQGLKGSGASSYSLGTSAQVMRSITSQCLQQGFKAPLIIPDVADSTFPSDASFDGTEIVSTIVPYFDNTLPGMKEFHQALAKYAPQIGTAKTPLSNPVLQPWVSGKLFETAVKAIGNKPITAESVKEGLYSLKGETLGGLTAPLTFTRDKVSPHNCYFYYKIENRAFVAPNGLSPTCVPDDIIAAIAGKLSH